MKKLLSIILMLTFALQSTNAFALRTRGTNGTSLPSQIKGAMHEKTGADHFIRKMLAMSANKDDWQAASDEWVVTGLIFSPKGIQNAGLLDPEGNKVQADEFGNYPNWIYRLQNKQNAKVIFVGRDDIRRLFPARGNEIARIKQEKEEELSRYLVKAKRAFQFGKILGAASEIPLGQISPYLEQGQIGDKDFPAIDSFYGKLEGLWTARCHNLALERFIEIIEDLHNASSLVRRGQLRFVSDAKKEKLVAILGDLENGGVLGDPERDFLISMHGELLRHQQRSIIESASWARGRATAVSTQHEPKTPAYQANLWVANWLAARFGPKNDKPIVLDAGANISVLWRVLKALDASVAGGVIDLEYDQSIFADAPNPLRVRADISDLDEHDLPKIIEATDDIARELFAKAHNFNIIVASFMLDQLSPEQLRNSLIAAQRLLAEPPQEEPAEDNLDDFPLFIIASPEHAPIANSGFDAALKEAGFKMALHQSNVTNQLSTEAKARLLREIGKTQLELVESFIAKPFHAAIYIKTKDVDVSKLKKMPLKQFVLKVGDQRKSKGINGAQPAIALDRLDAAQLGVLDVISSLRPTDFQAQSSDIVTRARISEDKQYKDFEEHLACLIFLSAQLNNEERDVLDDIVDLWDNRQAAFITQEQANFVMKRPLDIGPRKGLSQKRLQEKYGHIKITADSKHDEARKEVLFSKDESAYIKFNRDYANKVFSLWEIYEIEEEYRAKRDLPSVFDETRSFISSRVRQIRRAVATVERQGMVPNLMVVGKAIGLASGNTGLRTWAEMNNVDLESLGVVREGVIDKETRINEIKAAVEKLKREGKAPSTAAVAEQINMQKANSLLNWARMNDVDIEALGVDKKIVDDDARLGELKDAVERLKKEGKVPNVDLVAKEMGLSGFSVLQAWANKAGVRLEDAGVVRMVGGTNLRKNTEARIQQIKNAVSRLKTRGKEPNITAVTVEMGFKGDASLKKWAEYNGVDLKELGVVWVGNSSNAGAKKQSRREARILQIREAVKRLLDENKTPYASEVAKAVGINRDSLLNWSKFESVDIDSLGVVKGERPARVEEDLRAQHIKDAVASLRSEGKPADAKSVAEKAGFNAATLRAWAHIKRLSLKELGVDISLKKIDKQERAQKIEDAVKILVAKGIKPNVSAVAKEIGISVGNLINWAKDYKYNLEELGVVKGSGGKEIDAGQRISQIKDAVKRLESRGRAPGVSAVAEEIGLASSTSLAIWLEKNNIDRAGLGIVEARKKEARAGARAKKDPGSGQIQGAMHEEALDISKFLSEKDHAVELQFVKGGSLYGPTPIEILPEIFDRLGGTLKGLSGKKLLDFGAGDLRVPLFAAIKHRMSAVAVEEDPDISKRGQKIYDDARASGIIKDGQLRFIGNTDAFGAGWEDYDAVYFYYTEPLLDIDMDGFRGKFKQKMKEMKKPSAMAFLFLPVYDDAREDFSDMEAIFPSQEHAIVHEGERYTLKIFLCGEIDRKTFARALVGKDTVKQGQSTAFIYSSETLKNQGMLNIVSAVAEGIKDKNDSCVILVAGQGQEQKLLYEKARLTREQQEKVMVVTQEQLKPALEGLTGLARIYYKTKYELDMPDAVNITITPLIIESLGKILKNSMQFEELKNEIESLLQV